MNKIKVGVCFALCSLAAPSMAQYMWQEEDGTEKIDLREDIQYGVEMQGSFSKGKTPLWLNANKHGLSSLEKNNGYLRGSLVRPLSADCCSSPQRTSHHAPLHLSGKFRIRECKETTYSARTHRAGLLS